MFIFWEYVGDILTLQPHNSPVYLPVTRALIHITPYCLHTDYSMSVEQQTSPRSCFWFLFSDPGPIKDVPVCPFRDTEAGHGWSGNCPFSVPCRHVVCLWLVRNLLHQWSCDSWILCSKQWLHWCLWKGNFQILSFLLHVCHCSMKKMSLPNFCLLFPIAKDTQILFLIQNVTMQWRCYSSSVHIFPNLARRNPAPRPHQVGFSVPSVYADFLAFWILGFLDRMKVLRESLWGL